MNTDNCQAAAKLPASAKLDGIEFNEFDWIKHLKDFAEDKGAQDGFKVTDIHASKRPIDGIVIDGTLITIPDTVVLNAVEFIKIGGVNPWAKPPEPTEAILTGAEIDTLVALVERGPLGDGDVPSKSARDSLVEKGFAARVIINGDDGYQAATYLGRDSYCNRYNGTTVEEAKTNRKKAMASAVPMRD